MSMSIRMLLPLKGALALACLAHAGLGAGAALAQQPERSGGHARPTVQPSRAAPASAPVLLSPADGSTLAGLEFRWESGPLPRGRRVEYTLTVAELPPGRSADEVLRQTASRRPRPVEGVRAEHASLPARRGLRFATVTGALEGVARGRAPAVHHNLLPEPLASRLVPGGRYAWRITLRADGRELASSRSSTFTAPAAQGSGGLVQVISHAAPTLLLYHDQGGDGVMAPGEDDPEIIEEASPVFGWDGPALSPPIQLRIVRLNYVRYAADGWVDDNGVTHHAPADTRLDNLSWLLGELADPNAVTVSVAPAGGTAFAVAAGQLEYDMYYACQLTANGESSQILVFRYRGP